MKDLESQQPGTHTDAAAAGGLVWQDLKLTLPLKRSLLSFRRGTPANPGTDKVLLEGLSGSVAPGEMLAIMGPSGAGKSTLLDVLSARKIPTEGSVTVGIGAKDVRSVSSYVEQADSLLGVLTVRETIWYSAKLSLPPSTSNDEIDRRTDLVIADLGLSGVAGQRIGTPIQRGVSGGQKRRVSIGCSLVTLPRILFLDEPTSGLDTFTAHEVVMAIRNLAKRHNIAVLATIHSPNWEIFSAFDKTLLLSKGRTIYQGSTLGVAEWFAGLGHKCPEHTNPADHMIGLVNDDFLESTRTVEEHTTVESKIAKGDTRAFADAWARHAAQPVTATNMRARSSSASTASAAVKNEEQPAAAAAAAVGTSGLGSQWSRTVTLTRRNFVNYSRNLLAYGVRLGMYLGMGVLLATVWVNLAQTDTRINDRLSVHFFSVAFLGFMAVAGIPSFLEERAVMLRESKNRLYGPLAFTLANTISTVPLMFICSLLFAVLAYWSIGLHPGAGYFFRFLAFLYLGVLAAEFQALLIAAAIPIFVAALAVCAFLNGFWMCVQGYFIRAVNLPRFWYYWAHWIDYETFAFDLLVKNDLRGLTFACQGSIAAGDCNCSFPSSLISKGMCAVSGEDVLEALQINSFSVGLYAAILVIILVVYRVLFYTVLRFQM